jgi:hypothetical protein
MPRAAMLAIWSDVARDSETDYLHWLTREHTSERVSTAGFEAVRVFRADRTDVSRYFICYDLAGPQVVTSAAYLAKLNNPSPWSQRIMPILGNFKRGGGQIISVAGTGQGGILAPVLFTSKNPKRPDLLTQDLAQRDAIAAVRFLQVDGEKTSVQTREKSMRANDQSFAGLLMIEGLNEPAVRAALDALPGLLAEDAPLAVTDGTLYRHVFSLHSDMLTAQAS